jgi:hypothetical protein
MIISSEPQSFQIGLDGFVWFMGVVEDTTDPLAVGRVKVRIFSWHDDTLATNDLPWAFPIRPVTQSRNTSDIRPGDWVLGFFLDGKLGQQPMVLGVFPSIPQGGLLGNLLGTLTKDALQAELGIPPGA